MAIILYDIPSTLPERAWNPNVWKARFSLNFKGIPYTTEWIEYPDITPHCKKLGIPPTGKRPDGSPYYSLPAIYDSSTGVYISDSLLIAQYLEKTYPDTHRLFPNGTAGVQSAFNEGFLAIVETLVPLLLPVIHPHLSPVGAAYLKLRVDTVGSKDLPQDWMKLQEGFDQVDAWYARNGGNGPFILGDAPSWSDVVVVSFLVTSRRVWGANSEKWKKLASWNGGRWKDLSDAFTKYEIIV